MLAMLACGPAAAAALAFVDARSARRACVAGVAITRQRSHPIIPLGLPRFATGARQDVND